MLDFGGREIEGVERQRESLVVAFNGWVSPMIGLGSKTTTPHRWTAPFRARTYRSA
jgi:hypothetical protein